MVVSHQATIEKDHRLPCSTAITSRRTATVVSPVHRAAARCIRPPPCCRLRQSRALICITTASMLRRTTRSRLQPRRHARRCVSTRPAIWSISASTSVTPHQFAPLLHQPHLQHLGLDLDVISVGLRARRLLPLAPQVSQVGNAALVEREAVTLPLDHAFGFELADVGPAAIEVLRQCRRADGRGLSGSPSRDRLGDGRAINGDGLSHRVRSCCVAVG